ncbi:MAG: hypothetical protein ABIE84_00270, partial [bacterium]
QRFYRLTPEVQGLLFSVLNIRQKLSVLLNASPKQREASFVLLTVEDKAALVAIESRTLPSNRREAFDALLVQISGA